MIETKEIGLYEKDYIDDLTAFGWQPTQTTSRRSGRSSYTVQIMARETSMPHYNDYRRLEEDYEAAKAKRKYYSSMEISTVFLLLLLLIIPGVLYIVFKKCQKADIKDHNDKCNQEMKKAVLAARNIK
jgi:hypothetical protein